MDDKKITPRKISFEDGVVGNVIDIKTPKVELLKKWKVLIENRDKTGKTFESFMTEMINTLDQESFEQIECEYDDQQIDYQIINTNGGFQSNLGLIVHFECKDQDNIGASPCYKALGHMWLSGDRIKTTVICTTGKFYATAKNLSDLVSVIGGKCTLILIDGSDIEKFLKSDIKFDDWFISLWVMYGTRAKNKKEFQIIDIPKE